MKKVLLSLLLLAISPLVAVPFKEIFSTGERGDFSIYQNGASVTILSIHSKSLPYITFEEITLPKRIYENVKGRDLNTWIRKGCPGNTSWSVMEIDIDTKEISSAYCFLRKAHLNIRAEDALISSLLNLDLEEVPEEKRLRIGPRSNTKKDTRAFWIPTMVVNGSLKNPYKLDVYKSNWEKDGSILSGREIDLYILNEFPFPYWIQIHGEIGSKKMVSLDSGKNLATVISHIPKMPPKFLSRLEKWSGEDRFSFLLQSNHAYKNFTVYAVEVTKRDNILHPMEASFTPLDAGTLKFNITKDTLDTVLQKGKKYRLYLSYESENEIKSILSKDIIHWK